MLNTQYFDTVIRKSEIGKYLCHKAFSLFDQYRHDAIYLCDCTLSTISMCLYGIVLGFLWFLQNGNPICEAFRQFEKDLFFSNLDSWMAMFKSYMLQIKAIWRINLRISTPLWVFNIRIRLLLTLRMHTE